MTAAREARVPAREGVLASLESPRAVTAAESRMLAGFGADLVAPAIVPAAIRAVHAGLEVLGVAVVGAPSEAAAPGAPAAPDLVDRMEIVLRSILRGGPA